MKKKKRNYVKKNIEEEQEQPNQRDIRDELKDVLADVFKEKKISRYKICKICQVDESSLSNVLAKKRHLATKTMHRLLAKIGYKVIIVKDDKGKIDERLLMSLEDKNT